MKRIYAAVALVLALVAIGAAGMRIEQQRCGKTGGALVQTYSGFQCINTEKVGK